MKEAVTPSFEPSVDLDARLSALVEAGLLGRFDRRVVEWLRRGDPTIAPATAIAAAFASAATSAGSLCVDLRARRLLLACSGIGGSGEASAGALRRALAAAPFVRLADESRETPFVLDGNRLYPDRAFLAESAIADAITSRLAEPVALSSEEAGRLRASMLRAFAHDPEMPFTEAMRAALTALVRRLAIVTGGPGTGKTTIVVRILVMLLEADPDARIRLLAPTGKAAARLADSIRGQVVRIDAAVRDRIPTEASTLHRALGVDPERPSRARFDARSPLPADVVIVDEASMVDAEMMARLFAALAPTTRIVLLGDRDQLASVDAGSVLGDLAGDAQAHPGVSPGFAAALAEVCAWPEASIAAHETPPIADALAVLTRSHRFDPSRGIGRLARAIREGSVEETFAALHSDEVTWLDPSMSLSRTWLEAVVRDGYRPLRELASAADVPAALDRFRILCAVRSGPAGVVAWNERVLDLLGGAGLARPILVTTNDYGVQLYNGDVGLVLTEAGRARVYFPDARVAEGVRVLSPSRLPAHEPVFAMTIHKSQGSELDEVLVVLPPAEQQITSRELLYTAITRARKRVTIHADRASIEAAVRSPIQRASGLRERLWGEATLRR